MTRLKLALGVLVALVVALGIGYVWGASGKGALTSALDDMKQQVDVAEARGHLLDARVSLYNVNFGDASRQFEEASAPLSWASSTSRSTWRPGCWRRSSIRHRTRRLRRRSPRSSSPGRSDYFAIVARSSTVIFRSEAASAACEITSGLPSCRITARR